MKERKASKTDSATTRRKPGRPSDNIPRKKMSMQLPEVLVEKVQDYAYWEGVSTTQAVSQILIQYFRNRKVKSRPRPRDLRAELEKLQKQA